MTQRCETCNHPKRLEIDRALIAGRNVAKLSRDYKVSESSLHNHKGNHITRQLVKHHELREIMEGEDLLGVVTDLLNASREILNKTKDDPKKYGIALASIRETRETIRLLWEVALKLEEFKINNDPYKQKWDEWKQKLKYLSLEEIEQMQALYTKADMLASGKKPGRRTDLEPKKRGPKPGHNHPQAVKIPTRKQRRRRRKPDPVKADEFDTMRNRLGMDNNPDPQPKGWP